MFDRFTARAKGVVSALERRVQVRGLKADLYSLLELLTESGGIAQQVLEKHGITSDSLKDSLAGGNVKIPDDTPHHPDATIHFSPEVRKVFELSLREALQMGVP